MCLFVQLPSVLYQEMRQNWPPNATDAYRDAAAKSTALIPELGPHGVVLVSAGKDLFCWSIGPDHAQSNCRTYAPVNADIQTMCCVTPVEKTFAERDQKIIVLAYESEVWTHR